MDKIESAHPADARNTFADFNASELFQPFSGKLLGEAKLPSSNKSSQVDQNVDQTKFSDSALAIKPVEAGIGEGLALLGIIGGGYAIMSGKVSVEKVLTKTVTTGLGLAARNPRTALALGAGAYLYNQFAPSDTRKK